MNQRTGGTGRGVRVLHGGIAAILLLPGLAGGCGGSGDTSAAPGVAPTADAAPDNEVGVEAAADGQSDGGGDAAADTSAPPDGGPTPLGFTPSNVPLAALPDGGGECVISAPDCRVDSDKGEISCLPSSAYAFAQIDQANGGVRAAVFVCERLRVESSAILSATGGLAVVLVGRASVQIVGTVEATASRSDAVAGGFPTMSGNQKGGGPGGGAAASAAVSAGGGAYCGRGGNGAAKSGSPGLGGEPWGAESLIPLLGGSGGGSNHYGGGAGGGAIQIVSGVTITVELTGVVSAGGGGGSGHEGTSGGGGSGGAILLEAPAVHVAGWVAVNGGGGGEAGGGEDGADATASSTPAPGAGDSGGDGSAGDDVDGVDGTNVSGNIGGGGGGAGRIRINSSPGGTSLTGTFSPSAATPCVTLGELANP